MATSFVCKPLLTGLGAGDTCWSRGPTPSRSCSSSSPRRRPGTHPVRGAELHAVEVSFGDASRVFHGGPASCAVYGVPAGLCDAVAKWGTARLEDLLEPAAALAGEGVALNAGQAYVAEILHGPSDLDA